MRVKDDSIIISGPATDLEVFGGKVVHKDTYLGDKRLEEEFVAIKFCEGIEGSFDGVETIEEGFLDRIPHLCEIEMADTVKDVGVTEQFKKVVHKNNILIRGSFDSYAEEFARKYKLRFLPSNMVLAQTGDFSTREGIDIITLRMFDDGCPCFPDPVFCGQFPDLVFKVLPSVAVSRQYVFCSLWSSVIHGFYPFKHSPVPARTSAGYQALIK